MDLINNGIIWFTIVNACKHIKIFYAQLKALKVYLDTCNIENSLHLNLGANNPQIVSSYKPNIQKLYLMCSSPFLWIFGLLFHYVTLKWFNFFFTTIDVISSSIFLRSHSLVVLILLDAELGALAITITWIQKVVSRNKKWQQYFVVILTDNLQCSLFTNKLNDYPQAFVMKV